MNQTVTKGIVLRRIKYAEADRIVTYITPDLGKISLMVKGARKSKSKLAGSIELFGESQITLIRGRGEIGNLVSARLIHNYGAIIKDLTRIDFGYKMIQLINKCLEIYSGSEFYELVKQSFDNLNDTKIDLRITQIWFSLNFLDIMGHQPSLIVKNISKEFNNYSFNFETMEFIGDKNGIYSRNDIKYLRLVLSRKPKFLSNVQFDDSSLDKLRELLLIMIVQSGFEY